MRRKIAKGIMYFWIIMFIIMITGGLYGDFGWKGILSLVVGVIAICSFIWAVSELE